MVLPPSSIAPKVEKSRSVKNIVAEEPTQATQKTPEVIENSEPTPPAKEQSLCESTADVKLDVPVKKKIVKVKTVKTGTKTVKIKSEKTTTVTLENGVTEVKKKVVKKQTDTTTIQLPNGVTNGVTSEECIVTNSIHTTNGDHFEEKNIEISSCQSEVIDPAFIEQQLSLADRRSSSTDIDSSESKSSESNHLLVNGSLRKDRSASPINFNFVVGKKSLKQKPVTESNPSIQPDVSTEIPKESNTTNSCDEADVKQNTIPPEEIRKESDELSTTHTRTNERSETSPARFQIKLTDSPAEKSKPKETPFLRSEVSPARFTIKLAKKKVDTVEPPNNEVPVKELSSEPEVSTKAEVFPEPQASTDKASPEPEISVEPEVCAVAVAVDATPSTDLAKSSESDIGTQQGNDDVDAALTSDTNSSKINNETESKAVDLEPESVKAVETEPVPESKDDVSVEPKEPESSKVELNNAEPVPKVKIVRKSDSNGEVGVKTVKSKISNKVDSETPVVGLKDVVLKRPKKVSETKVGETVNGLPTEGVTTEVKKKVVKKVKDATSATGEVKKKVVKKVVGSATVNGTGEVVVKKLVKKKAEVASDAAPEVKVKVVKKKADAVVTDVETNVEEPPKTNGIISEQPEVENPIAEAEPEPAVNNKEATEPTEPTETKMDEELSNLQNDFSPLYPMEKELFDPVTSGSEDRTTLRLDDSISLNANSQKYYDETPLFISTAQSDQHDLSLGLPLSDKNRRDRQMQGMDEDLALGASASPVESKSEASNNYIPLAICDTPSSSTDYVGKLYSGKRAASFPFFGNRILIEIFHFLGPKPIYGYVGLVNQAMTCYLNSLLQALFMTPEFRNALYNWEFDGHEESKSIPYQLQRLFLNLQVSVQCPPMHGDENKTIDFFFSQTSSKVAIETTDLTKSFGWTSSDAWHQHDVQELCRVMFDALEQKFKNTKQADLINRLYEGKMIDYVKCLECSTEKTREDTLLDIPLPVRPFGSNMAYGSVEEALRAFVQPETLDGNNQYFCDKCDKKCDAHKGLKFTRFPYILTLHLKRFDFDYNTLHRIKLNDK